MGVKAKRRENRLTRWKGGHIDVAALRQASDFALSSYDGQAGQAELPGERARSKARNEISVEAARAKFNRDEGGTN